MGESSAEDVLALRTRRAERPQKQREANVERAAKMHQVRMAAPRPNDLSDDQVTGRIHIGCSGWYYWHWKGKFHPAEVPSSQYFSIYQSSFKTVELNAPFYAWPTIGAVKTWIRQANSDFVYTIKVCELITHIKRFDETKMLVEDFGYVVDLLGRQMGCLLFQLPPSVRYTPEMLHSSYHSSIPSVETSSSFATRVGGTRTSSNPL